VAGDGTRQWAYRWIEEHIRHLAPVRILGDIGGGGADSVLCARLAQYAQRVLVIDQIGNGRRRGKVEEIVTDLEHGLLGLADASVDVFVTASSIEHLTARGQQRVFADVERVLRPNGVFCGTISYITRLDDDVLRLLQSDPVFAETGSSVLSRFDAKACLDAAPRLRPAFAPVNWSHFPGFEGFDEQELLGNGALVSGQVGSYASVRCRPEVDALRLAWYELGLFLRKDA
jgi:SAM-dependent methyltransferase